MDGIEKITGRIAADASQEIAAIQAEADYYLRSFEEMFNATDLG